MKTKGMDYRHFFHSLPVACLAGKAYYDKKGRLRDMLFLQINREFKKITGHRAHRIIGRKATDKILLAGKTGFPWLVQAVKAFRNTKKTLREQVVRVRNRWLKVSLLFPDKEHFILLFQDISEKKEKDDHYRSLVDHSLQGIIVVEGGRVRLVNPVVCRLLGMTKNRLYSMPFTRLFREIHPDERSVIQKRFRDRMKGKKVPDRYEFRVRLKNGETRWLDTMVTRITFHSKKAFELFFNDITDLKINEELTRKSHLILQGIIDSIPLPVYYMNKQGLFLGCNSAYERITGLNRNRIIGNTAFDIMPEKEARIFTNSRNPSAGRPKARIRESRIRYADGTEHSVLLHKATFSGPNGRTAGCVGVLMDITERKKYEQALKESETRYRLLFNKVLDAVLVHELLPDRPGCFIEVNDQACLLTGYSREELLHMNPGQLETPVQRAQSSEIMRQVLNRGQAHFITDLITKDGSAIPVELYIHHFNLMGKTAVLSMARNIKERLEAEKRLSDSEKKFSLAFEVSPLLLALVDYTTHRYVEVNQMFLDTLKFKKEEVIGRSTLEMEIFADLKERDQALKLIEQTGYLKDFKVRIKTRDNEIRIGTFSVQKLILHDKAYLLTVMHDITEQEKLAEQLIRSENLSAVGQLAAGIAHEFNNILTVIKGSVQLARLEGEGAQDLRVREMLSTLENESDKAQAIISQMMAFSKPQAMQKSREKISEIIKEVIRIQEKQLALENISVDLKLPLPEESSILADRNQMRQVFLNLFLNARHALKPKGLGHIKINIRETSDYVIVDFSDDGAGMDEETRKKIFMPFFTTKGAFARDGLQIKGTGLGLSICYTIIRQHNGTISFESRPGRGTCFTITLPRLQGEDSLPEVKQPAPQKKEVLPVNRDFKILIIDDEKQILTILKKILNQLGFPSVTCTDSGEEALGHIKENAYDIIFLDWLMPGMDGKQILRSAKEMGTVSKIILLTGKIDLSQEELKPFRIFGILRKPFDIREIREILEKCQNA